jgi:hypothetical protein
LRVLVRVRIFIINSGKSPTYPSPHIRMERSQTAGGRFTKKEWILISTRDHHRSPLRSVTGDPLEVSQTPEMGGGVGPLTSMTLVMPPPHVLGPKYERR